MKQVLQTVILLFCSIVTAYSSNFINSDEKDKCSSCDNLTYGGLISGNESGCGQPTWDPSIIINADFPVGGSGAIEYVWMYTTSSPTAPMSQWFMAPNSNTAYYDPGPISQTTYYRRCARREGCTDYVGETNIVTKTYNCCDNVTNPGKIGINQKGCKPAFNPDTLINITLPTGGSGNLEYAWYKSNTNIPFDINNSNWTIVSGADKPYYDPPALGLTTYYVRVVKRSGCIDYLASNIITITLNSPGIVTALPKGVDCYGNSTGSILVSVIGGKAPFNFEWTPNTIGNVQNPVNLPAGNYSVTATDANGCSANVNTIITQPSEPLQASISKTNPKCNGVQNGTATASASGGTSPYIYSWSNGTQGNTISNLGVGVYTVTVIDFKNCTTTASVTITEPAVLTLNVSKIDAKCKGGNGSATASTTGGTGTITYNWSNGQTGSTLNNLVAGNYSVTATDANGCSKATSVTINEPTDIVLTTTKTDSKCHGGNGSASASASGGTGAITYTWSNGQTGSSLTNVTAGSYTVTAKDANGCTKSASVTINEPTELVLSVSKTDAKCKGGNGSATASATGGTGTVTYTWSNGQSGATISNVSAGTYSVTSTDVNGCTKSLSVTIGEPSEITLTVSKTDALCKGGKGTATASASGGTGVLTFTWSNGQGGTSLSNLSAGSYTVTVKDVNGCSKSSTVTINEPADINISISKSDPKCKGETGSATASAVGGTGTITFTWSNGQSGANLTNVTMGSYSVTARDANGCTKSASVTLMEPSDVMLSVSKTDAKCHGGNGSATASATGGTGTITYSWSNGQSGAALSNVGAGTYSVVATDANGCTKSASVTINEPTELVLSVSKTDAKCKGGNGSATASATGGTGTITYSWSNGQSGATLSNVGAGTYSVVATDANGCTKSASVTINEPTELVLSVSKTDAKCKGGNGSATASATGGTGTITYSWSNGQIGATLSNVGAGTYSVVATDANGCTKSASVTINEPTELVLSISKVDAKCKGGNGSATASATGGTGTITYSWSNGQSGAALSNVEAGTYSVVATDANGCTKSASVTINEPTELVLSVSKTDAKCKGGNGSATASATGGTGTITYAWSNGQSGATLSNVGAGTYSVVATDANGCTKSASVTINEPTELVLSVSKTDAKCKGGNGSATASATGGTGTITYSWSNGQSGAALSNVGAGTYSVVATDANGCTKSASVTINEPTELVISVSKTDAKCKGGNGSATASTTGGTGTITYTWSNGQSGATLSNVGAGTYSVVATDANGCTKSASVTINEPTELVLSVSKTDAKCHGGNGSATASATGGTGTITYTWSNGQIGAALSNVGAGTYSVVATDANGCTKSASVTINEPTELVISISKVDAKCKGGNGSATASATGGTGTITYSWSNGQSGATLSNVGAGTYSVVATDANGCTKSASITINEPTQIIVTINKKDARCFGETGNMSASATGGTGNYTYTWSNGATTQTISPLPAGTYTVTVKDDNGCTATASSIIIQPSDIQLTVSKLDVKCYNGQGSATASATGGTPGYTYSWSTGQTGSSVSLSAGTYTVTVFDNNACSKVASVTINQPNKLEVDYIKKNPSCYQGNDGEIKVLVTGGVLPYNYLWNPSNLSGENVKGLSAGTYTVTVIDGNNCTATISITLEPASQIVVQGTSNNPKCFGENSGNISLTVTGGSPNYSFRWSNGNTSQNISNLIAGNYTVTVTDSKGCSATKSFTLTAPTQLTCSAKAILKANCTQISTHGGTDGEAEAFISGGTLPYTIVWSNGQTGTKATGLSAGTYSFTVTDANGCKCSSYIVLNNPAKIGDFVWLDENANGIQDNNEKGIGGVTVTLTGTDSKGNPITKTVTTGPDGKYLFDGLFDGDYKITFNTPTGHGVSPKGQGGNDALDSDVDPTTNMTKVYSVKSGDNITTVDAGYYKKPNIGNYVWIDLDRDGVQDTNEVGRNGILVKLMTLGKDGKPYTSDDIVLEQTLTANDTSGKAGYYLFKSLMPGQYYLMFGNLPNGFEWTGMDKGNNDALDSDVDTLGNTQTFIIAIGQKDDLTFDAGLTTKCNNTVYGGTIGFDEIICGSGNAASKIVNITFPTGGSGTLEYLWLRSTKGPIYIPGDQNWQAIPNSNSPDLDPGILQTSTYFVRCSRREGCLDYPAESNVVSKKIENLPIAEIENKPTGDICINTNTTWGAKDAGNTASYQWTFESGSPAVTNTRVATNVQFTALGTKTITLKVTMNGCSSTTTYQANVINCLNGGVGFKAVRVKQVEEAVNLEWEMKNEKNLNHQFIIYRTSDSQIFEEIGNVKAEEATDKGIFKFTDEKPIPGYNSYFVKHLTPLGKTVSSSRVSTFFKSDDKVDFSVFPNPFVSEVLVRPTQELKDGGNIMISNQFAEVVKEVPFDKATQEVRLDFSNYPSGVYFIQIKYNKFRKMTQKVVKID